MLTSASAMRARDIGQRADLDGLDQAFQHVAEQLDLLAGIAVGRRQEQVRDPPEGIEMLFRGAGLDGRLDFIGNRSCPTSLVLSVLKPVLADPKL